jgi:ribosomal protein S5
VADIFTTAGKGFTTLTLIGTTAKYVGWGTGAGTAAVADTTLSTEAAEARTVGVQTQQTTTVTNDTYQVTGTITSASTQTLTNAGVLTAAAAGTLALHSDFTGVPLVSGDSIAFTFKLKFA